MDVHRTGAKVRSVVIVVMAVICCFVGTVDTAMAAEAWDMARDHVASNRSGFSRALWEIGVVKPGHTIQLPGTVYYTVFSSESWELHLSSDVRVNHVASASTDWQTARKTKASDDSSSSLVILDLIGDFDQHPSLTRLDNGAWVVRGTGDTVGGPTELGLLFDLHASWDDPADTALEAEITATLSQGDKILTAYVQPSVLHEGERQPIRFWYYVPTPAEVVANVRGDSAKPAQDVQLLVLDDNETEIARVTSRIQATGWQSITWEGIDGLAAGRYLLRVVTDEQLLGSGWLRVVASTGQGDGVAPLSGIEDQKSVENPVSNLRMAVASVPIRLGEIARWTVTVINPEERSVQSVQVEICLPPGVIWLGADIPADHFGRSGITCHTHLLGSLSAESETSFSLTMTTDQDVLIAQRTGLIPTIEFRLSGAHPHTGRPMLFHAMRMGTDTDSDPLIGRQVTVAGLAYLDVNGSGQYEPGEPILSGASIVADGKMVATTNRSGQYRVAVPWHTKLLWVDTPRGVGLPQRTEIGTVRPFEQQIIDLPVRASDGDATGRVQVSADGGLLIGADRLWSATRLYWKFDAPGGAIDGGIDFENDSLSEPGFRLTGHGGSDALSWEGEVYRGLPRTMRSGVLRPSEPIQSGFRFGLQTVLADQRPGLSDTFLLTAPRTRQGSALIGKAEVGYAEGDVWSCALYAYEGDWLMPKLTLKGRVSSAHHERVTAKGIKTDHAVLKTAQATSAILLQDAYRWPVFVEVSHGIPRTLAPSCGLSPHAGMVWRVIGSAPPVLDQGGIIESIEISGGKWPQGGDAAFEENSADFIGDLFHDIPHNEEVKAEFALRFRSLDVNWLTRERSHSATLTTEAAVQLGKQPMGQPWMRPALRLKARLDGRHDFQLELGPGTLYNTTSVRPSADPGRLQMLWRLNSGPLRPWIRYEKNGLDEPSYTGEWGVQVDLANLFGHTQSGATAHVQLSRAIRKASTLDTISLRGSLAGLKTSLSWSGRTPFHAPRDRVVWQAEIGYELQKSHPVAALQDRCPCSDFKVHNVGISLNSEWTNSGSEYTYEFLALGSSPFGKYRLAIGTRRDAQGGMAAAYDTTSLSLLYPLDTWSLGGELVQKRDQIGGAPQWVSTMVEVRKKLTSEITAHSTITRTRGTDHEKPLKSSLGGVSTISVRRSIGLDWSPSLKSYEPNSGAQPVTWALRAEVAWTDEKPAELVIGLSLPTLW